MGRRAKVRPRLYLLHHWHVNELGCGAPEIKSWGKAGYTGPLLL